MQELTPAEFERNIKLIDIGLKILTFLVLTVTAGLTVRRFGLQRESSTFLRITVSAKEVLRRGALSLMSISIKLENLGQTKIDARQRGSRGPADLLYDDKWDLYHHAGTLKIRPIPDVVSPTLFDWYSLAPVQVESALAEDTEQAGSTTPGKRDLEQLNYLDEYQNPKGDFKEAHFWLEPKESYELTVSVWLPQGTYAAKAVFLGRDIRPKNEEYWSHMTVFQVGDQSQIHPALPAPGSPMGFKPPRSTSSAENATTRP